ncbi:MAG: LPP20 family lipoprotein [Halopseudomonas sp.]
MIPKLMTLWLTVLAAVMLSGCDTMQYYYDQGQHEESLRQDEFASVEQTDFSSEDQVDSSAVVQVDSQPIMVTATGYAPISLQPGQTRDHKVLMAMRASKLQAYQELAAIVHGQQLFGTSQVRDMVMQNDQFNAAVGGVIRGARVVKTYPVQTDTYATILELDLRDVQRAYIDMQ